MLRQRYPNLRRFFSRKRELNNVIHDLVNFDYEIGYHDKFLKNQADKMYANLDIRQWA